MTTPSTANGLPANELVVAPSGPLALAPPDSDCLPAQSAPIMIDAINASTKQVVEELDALSGEISRLKGAIVENAEGLKDHISRHFALGAEAIAFRNRVRDRLLAISNGQSALGAEGAP